MNEQIFHVGSNFILEEGSPNGLCIVFFEDDGETGYFYAADDSEADNAILDAVHIYNVKNVVDRDQSSRFSIVWSEDSLKTALLINGYPHAAFDFSKRRGYCRTNFPNFPEKPESDWRSSDHSWSDDAVAWLYSFKSSTNLI